MATNYDNRTLGPEERMGEPEQDPRIDDIIDFAKATIQNIDESDINLYLYKIALEYVMFCLENEATPSYESWKKFVQLNNEI